MAELAPETISNRGHLVPSGLRHVQAYHLSRPGALRLSGHNLSPPLFQEGHIPSTAVISAS